MSVVEWMQAAAAHYDAGRLHEAEKLYRQALATAPGHAEAWHRLGMLADHAGAARDAVGLIRRAIELDANRPEYWNNLGTVHENLRELDEAERAFKEAVRLRPDYAVAHNNLGEVYKTLGRLAASIACYRTALAHNPDFDAAHSNLLMSLNYDLATTRAELHAAHLGYGATWRRRQRPSPPHHSQPDPERMLRLGYVSPDLRLHAVMRFFEPILRAHDRRRFAVILYSECPITDDVGKRLREHDDTWRVTWRRSTDDVARQVREDRIDILVDLAGHTRHNRLDVFAAKPAPVQATYLGYPNITGLDAIDYRITDETLDPPAENDCQGGERLVRLGGSFFCFEPPRGAPNVSPPPSLERGHVTFGIHHPLMKLNEPLLECWRGIHERLPTARFLFLRDSLEGDVARELRQRLAASGIPEACYELRKISTEGLSYLEQYRDVDLVLDCFPFTGHTMTCEVLWQGVPVVTLCGDRPSARLSASVLRSLAINDFVAHSREEYVDIAVRAATDAVRLTELRSGLRDMMREKLCDAATFTSRLEEAYRTMWGQWCDGQGRATGPSENPLTLPGPPKGERGYGTTPKPVARLPHPAHSAGVGEESVTPRLGQSPVSPRDGADDRAPQAAEPFGTSWIWEQERRAYEDAGITAWQREQPVPFHISSSPLLADIYARLILAFMDDARTQAGGAGYDPREPLYVVELGAGAGRFAYLLQRELARRRAEHPTEIGQIVYVFTDAVQANVDAASGHPLLREALARGEIDFARFDATRDEQFRCLGSGVCLGGGAPSANAMVMIANYVFDTLTQDLFRVHGGRLEEGRVRRPAWRATAPPPVQIEYHELADLGPASLCDPFLRQLFDEQARLGVDGGILIPTGAMRAMQNVAAKCGGRLLILAGDKGHCDARTASFTGEPPLAWHGPMFSISVNFHAIARYIESLGGQLRLPREANSVFVVAAGVLGLTATPHLAAAYADTVDALAPTDLLGFFTQTPAATATLADLLALLRLSHHDPEIVATHAEFFAQRAVQAEKGDKERLLAALQRVAQRYFPIGPRDARIPRAMARLAYAVEAFERALEYLEQASAMEQGVEAARTLFNMALCQRSLGRFGAALASLERAAQRDSQDAQIARVLAQTRDMARTAERGAPAWLARGDQHHGRGELAEAEACYRQALVAEPARADALGRLGEVLAELGRAPEAVSTLTRAVEIDAQAAENHHRLGNLLEEMGRTSEAEASFRRAVAARPDYFASRAMLGQLLANQGKLDEANTEYRGALALRAEPKLRIVLATLLPPVYASMDEVVERRAKLVENLEQLHHDGVRVDPSREAIPNLFYVAYQGRNDRDIMQSFARLFATSTQPAPRPRRPAADGRVRVGLLSQYFCNHTIGTLNRGLVETLDRAKFHVTVLSAARGDDDTARVYRQHADRFVPLPGAVPAARRALAEVDLDLLYFSDLGMSCFTLALAHSRWAPVQCVTWGHPLTTGIPAIDYFVSGKLYEADGAQAHYTETLVPVDGLQTCYPRPQLPANPKSRADFGFPADAHLYGCPQTLFKVHPEFDTILADLLRQDSRGLLVMLEGKHRHWTELLLARWRQTMGDVVERVRFLPQMPRESFLALSAAVDVLLDPLHFGGGNTTFEALAVGTPVVTLPSPFLRGRLTYGMYQKMEMPDCVADSASQYVEMALRLGTEADYNRQIRERIRAQSGALFEDRASIRSIEEFFLSAVAKSRERTP